MKSNEFLLTDAKRKANCMELISRMETGKGWKIRIYQGDENRRHRQNNLMWSWWRQVSDHTGYPLDYVHRYMKRMVLYGLYWEMEIDRRISERVQNLYAQNLDDLDAQVDVSDLMRTSSLSIKQFSKYLHDCDMFWVDQGLMLEGNDE